MSTTKESLCRICGASACYSFYGTIACTSCKMFFKRNATNAKSKLFCRFTGDCEVNEKNRHICAACRLAKCFQHGMTEEKFHASIKVKRRGKSVPNNNAHISTNRTTEEVNFECQSPTINLLRNDQSSMSPEQWTLLTNLFHNYEEVSSLPIVQQLVDIHDHLQSKPLDYQTLINDSTIALYGSVGRSLCSNADLCQLSSVDRTILLRNTTSHLICLITTFLMSSRHLFDFPLFSDSIKIMYGEEFIHCHRFARKFTDPDLVFVRLAFALASVTEQNSSYACDLSIECTDAHRIVQIQNKYAELIWKYLLDRYGEYQSVQRFLRLINWFIAVNLLVIHSNRIASHMTNIESIIERVEMSFISNDIDEKIENNEVQS